jgi:hypothetical protein
MGEKMINPLNHPHRSKSAETRAYNDGYAAGLNNWYAKDTIACGWDADAIAWNRGYADGRKALEFNNKLPPPAGSVR